MAKKKNLLVFMDVCIDGDPKERMVFEVSLCFNYVGCTGKYLYIECSSCILINLSVIFCSAAFLGYCSQDCRKFPSSLYR